MSETPSTNKNIRKPAALLILDGWGVAPVSAGNAITQANTPNMDMLIQRYFTTTLQAAGEAVGLKWGEMGNSEVGHLAIGAGRIIFQVQPRIDRSIIDGSFITNKALLKVISQAKQDKGRLHLIGLLSDSGVHATIEHLFALVELAQLQNIETFVHMILDGRDAQHNSGLRYLRQLLNKLRSLHTGQVASVSGRFWAMDRDNNWDRVERAYRAMVANQISGSAYTDPVEAVAESYQAGVFDEQFEPATIIDSVGQAIGPIRDGDAIVMFNFRPDRSRQLARALADPNFDKFDRPAFQKLHIATMAQYEATLPVAVMYPPEPVASSLPEVISKAGLTQFHIAETEKYAHVTYFIGGGQENPFPGEDRAIVPSLGVASYETKPEMSAPEIRDKVLEDLRKGGHDFYVVNFANADMIGHTGNLKATIQGVETVDKAAGDIVKSVHELGGLAFITADHGNAEGVIKPNTGEIDKEHSAMPVPFIIAAPGYEQAEVSEGLIDLSTLTPGGFLSDITPTILKVMGIPQPEEMTGRSLV